MRTGKTGKIIQMMIGMFILYQELVMNMFIKTKLSLLQHWVACMEFNGGRPTCFAVQADGDFDGDHVVAIRNDGGDTQMVEVKMFCFYKL